MTKPRSKAKPTIRQPSSRQPDPLTRGLALHRAGRFKEAERCYRAVPRRAPGFPDALHLRGLLAHQSGENEAAIRLIRQALERQPANPVYHYNLGEVLRAAGQPEPAVAEYRRALALEPDYADAHFNLGNALLTLGRLPDAVQALHAAARLSSKDPQVQHALGNACMAAGDAPAAVTAYRRAAELEPASTAAALSLADALARAGHTRDAVAQYRALVGRESPPVRALRALPLLLFECGDIAAAREQVEQWHAAAPKEAEALCSVARTLTAVAAYDRAIAVFEEALEIDPESAQAAAGLGGVLQSQGRFEEAAHRYGQALALEPGLGVAYAALAANRHHVLNPEQRAAMERLVEDRQTDERPRMHLHFALGHLFDREGAHERAFAHFREGNRIHARREPFDSDVFSDRIERIMAVFDRNFFAARAGFGDPSERPVFVVGMPRSGTSLVEQIVASHPRAFGAGELNDVRRMMRELPVLTGSAERFPECAAVVKRNLARRLARRYLGALAARAGGAERVTDKMPFNLLWLGLIALLFPNARVVYCRREAMDNALSCYFQIFDDGLRFSYDLEHLGLVYRRHERLMAHWAQHVPLRMLTVDYEALVADQEAESRRLIEFLGLPWDDRCLDFHQVRRAVRTASVWQVRQPMYRSSVARWRAYEPWLEPLRDALERYG